MTSEEREAYNAKHREYYHRPEVTARRKAKQAQETPEKREARLKYQREYRALNKPKKSTSRGLTSDPREASKGQGDDNT